MRDVEWVESKGKFNFKALTPKAMEAMGTDMNGPWRMAAEVFWMGVTPEDFVATLDKLQAMGLQTSKDIEHVEISKFTDF